MPTAIVSSKGQITLPAGIRRKAGIAPHDRVVIEATSDGLLVKRAPDFFGLKGYLGRARSGRLEERARLKAVVAHSRSPTSN